MNLPNKLSQAAHACSILAMHLKDQPVQRDNFKMLEKELLELSDQFHELEFIQALDHIDNLLDCINDARMSTIPPITDGEELTTISFGYTEKIRAANHFLKRLKYHRV